MSSHGYWKMICCGLLLFVLAGSLRLGSVFASTLSMPDYVVVPYGEVRVIVFVISLDGVEGPAGVNESRLINGTADASTYFDFSSNDAIYWDLSGDPLTLAQVKVNVTFTVVRDWDTYMSVVESGVGVIVVNAHGETLPVPAGYSKESWVDRIAEAMASRNVTWVHVAGYPLWHCSFEGGGEVDWGVDGFKRLMNHIGKGNVTCSYPNGTRTGMSAEGTWVMAHNWGTLYDCEGVEFQNALYGSEFGDCLLMVIWGNKEWLASGATVRFCEAGQSGGYGFYVHVGISETYGYSGWTDEDYFMGFAGAAEAVYFVSVRRAAEAGILSAEEAVAAARSEGRTSGLSSAIRLIEQAKEHYGFDKYWSACDDAHLAVEAASGATKPKTLTAFQVALLALSTGGGVAAAVFIVARKTRNSKKVVPESQKE